MSVIITIPICDSRGVIVGIQLMCFQFSDRKDGAEGRWWLAPVCIYRFMASKWMRQHCVLVLRGYCQEREKFYPSSSIMNTLCMIVKHWHQLLSFDLAHWLNSTGIKVWGSPLTFKAAEKTCAVKLCSHSGNVQRGGTAVVAVVVVCTRPDSCKHWKMYQSSGNKKKIREKKEKKKRTGNIYFCMKEWFKHAVHVCCQRISSQM